MVCLTAWNYNLCKWSSYNIHTYIIRFLKIWSFFTEIFFFNRIRKSAADFSRIKVVHFVSWNAIFVTAIVLHTQKKKNLMMLFKVFYSKIKLFILNYIKQIKTLSAFRKIKVANLRKVFNAISYFNTSNPSSRSNERMVFVSNFY